MRAQRTGPHQVDVSRYHVGRELQYIATDVRFEIGSDIHGGDAPPVGSKDLTNTPGTTE